LHRIICGGWAQRIESQAITYHMRNVLRIVAETELRITKLGPTKKDQLDLENRVA